LLKPPPAQNEKSKKIEKSPNLPRWKKTLPNAKGEILSLACLVRTKEKKRKKINKQKKGVVCDFPFSSHTS
jgi:hypothetical protein